MKHFIQQLTLGTVLGVAMLVGSAVTAPAMQFTIDFSSGSQYGPYSGSNPRGYTEDHLTVESQYASSSAHIHLPDFGGAHGTVLTIHDGCCSSPYLFSFSAPVNIVSVDWKWGGSGLSDHTFLTDAPGASPAYLPYVSDWTTFTVATQATTPGDFMGITSILLTMNNGDLKLDNIIYELAENQPVPEPSTMLLLGSGLVGIVAWRYRKHQA